MSSSASSSSVPLSSLHPIRATLRNICPHPLSLPLPTLYQLHATPTMQQFYIGRDQRKAQIYLDSKVSANLISRLHGYVQLVPCEALQQAWKQQDSGAGEMKKEEEEDAAASCTCHWRYVDLHSLNGSFVNDVKTAESVLVHSDLLVFGGGGLHAMGWRFKQPASEFAFRFEINREYDKITRLRIEQGTTTTAQTKQEANISEHKKKEDVKTANAAAAVPSVAAPVAAPIDVAPHSPIRASSPPPPSSSAPSVAAAAASATTVAASTSKKRKSPPPSRSASSATAATDTTTVAVAEEEHKNSQPVGKKSKIDTANGGEQKEEEAGANRMVAAAASTSVLSPPSSSSSSLSLADLQSECQCAVCCELLLHPFVLPCSHRVCNVCLLKWMGRGKTQCVECQTEVDFYYDYRPLDIGQLEERFKQLRDNMKKEEQSGKKRQLKALSCEEQILMCEEQLTSEEKKARAKRVEELLKREEKEKRKEKTLIDHLEQATAANKQALRITDVWKPSERTTFLSGIGPYVSLGARLAYTRFTGLSVDLLKATNSKKTINTICENIQITLPKETMEVWEKMRGDEAETEKEKQVMEDCKRRIYLFMAFGVNNK